MRVKVPRVSEKSDSDNATELSGASQSAVSVRENLDVHTSVCVLHLSDGHEHGSALLYLIDAPPMYI